MSDRDMIDARQLSLVLPHKAAPGTLLLGPRDRKVRPMLCLKVDQDGKQVPFYMGLDPALSGSFVAYAAEAGSSPHLSADGWRLRVDPDSRYSPTSRSPASGDVFISDGLCGFVASIGYDEAYISVAGALLPEPNWTSGYIGFDTWEVVVDRGPLEDPLVVARRRSAPPT